MSFSFLLGNLVTIYRFPGKQFKKKDFQEIYVLGVVAYDQIRSCMKTYQTHACGLGNIYAYRQLFYNKNSII